MKLLLCICIAFLFSSTTLAESFIESFQEKPLQEGEIVVEQHDNISGSYKERRPRHGALFSINYEKFYPVDYFSIFRDAFIEDIIGDERINLIGGELGYKFNFQLGSISVLGGYSQGKIKGTVGSDDRFLTFKRQGVSAGFALDNIMNEPWVVPYVQAGIHQFLVEEEDELGSDSTTTGAAFNYKVGMLFQLNWIEAAIDPNSHREGLRSSGLQNTFLDVYTMVHASSNNLYDPNNAASEGDPDLKSDTSNLEVGVGLKMEF